MPAQGARHFLVKFLCSVVLAATMSLPPGGPPDPLTTAGQLNVGSLLDLLQIRRASQDFAGTSFDVSGKPLETELLQKHSHTHSGVSRGRVSEKINGDISENEGWQGFESPNARLERGIDSVDNPDKKSAGDVSEVDQIEEAAKFEGEKIQTTEGNKGIKPQSWLDNPSLQACFLDTGRGLGIVAYAYGDKVVLAVLERLKTREDFSSIASLPMSHVVGRSFQKQVWQLDSRCEAVELVTALEWIPFSEADFDTGSSHHQAWLCLGTSAGYTRFFKVIVSLPKLDTQFILAHRAHRAPVVNLCLRMRSSGLATGDSLQELSIVYPGALVAVQASDLMAALLSNVTLEGGHERFDEETQGVSRSAGSKKGQDLASDKKIRRRKGQQVPAQGPPIRTQQSHSSAPELESRAADAGTLDTESIDGGKAESQTRRTAHLPFLKWRFKSSTNSDAAIMGVRPGKFLGGYVEEPAYGVVVVGSEPFVAFYDAPIREETESVLSRASGVATRVGSAVYSSASTVLSLGRALPPRIGSKLFDTRGKQEGGTDTEAKDVDPEAEDAGPSNSVPASTTDVMTTAKGIGKPLQGLQRAVAENLGAAAASVNSAAVNMVSVGPAGLGGQLAASVGSRSASLGSLTTGLGLRDKLRSSLGIKASRSLETVHSVDSVAPQGEGNGEIEREEHRAEVLAEQERLERMQGVAGSLVGCLDDPPRKALRVWMASRGSLGAVADNLGRVSLIDGLGGLVVRVWKGYRDAQCAWVERENDGQVSGCICWSRMDLQWSPHHMSALRL
jgi:hypothetical protein